MSIVTLNLASRKFKLDCPDESHEHIMLLSEKLDNQLQEVMKTNPSASFELAMVMLLLNLQDERQSNISVDASKVLEEADKDNQTSLGIIHGELKKVLDKM